MRAPSAPRPGRRLRARLLGMVLLPRRRRVVVFRTVAELLDAGEGVETALAVVASGHRSQGDTIQAWYLERWIDALRTGTFAETVAGAVPTLEGMIFGAYGEIPAERLFVSAAAVAEMRGRQTSALTKALAMPVALFAATAVGLWAAGGWFLPALTTVLPADRWDLVGRWFHAVATWIWNHDLQILVAVSAAAAALAGALSFWTGPGRAAADRFVPFSLHRLLAGSAFLFVALEFTASGIDLYPRGFRRIRRHTTRYATHRIGAIERGMGRGLGFGTAMVEAGHGFPDPELQHVIAALERRAGWEVRAARFVEGWVARSEDMLRIRTAIASHALNAVVALVGAAMLHVMAQAISAAQQMPTAQ